MFFDIFDHRHIYVDAVLATVLYVNVATIFVWATCHKLSEVTSYLFTGQSTYVYVFDKDPPRMCSTTGKF